MNIYIILTVLIILYIIFIIFVYLLKIKIDDFENKIMSNFKERNNQIPSIYEITKPYIQKHDEVFKESLKLKKKDFGENGVYTKLAEKIYTYKLIHNEINFIFRVCEKNAKLNKDFKFLFLKDNIAEKSEEIGKNLEIYKKIVNQLNTMILIKNITIIWLFVPISKKETI